MASRVTPLSPFKSRYDEYTPRKKYMKDTNSHPHSYFHSNLEDYELYEQSMAKIINAPNNSHLPRRKRQQKNQVNKPSQHDQPNKSKDNDDQTLETPFTFCELSVKGEKVFRLRKYDIRDEKQNIHQLQRVNSLTLKDDLAQKCSLVKSKLARYSRMKPRCQSEAPLTPKKQKTIPRQSSSDRENQIMRRVSLPRLLEEKDEQMEQNVERIQNLSDKINYRLQSLIRNYA